jgi:hypothetical protein
MVLMTSLIWAAVGAAVVAWLIERGVVEDTAALERGEEVAVRGGDPTLAFVVCTGFLVAAPFFLLHARGARGFVEGSLILGGAAVMNMVTVFALTVFFGH